MNLQEINSIQSAQFPEIFINYLLAHDWNQIELPEKWNDIAILRKFYDGQEEEIVIPKSQVFADYVQRMSDALGYFSLYEKLPIEQVKSALLTSDYDVLKIRITGESVDKETISYSDLQIITKGFNKVLTAAACYILEPKTYFSKLHRAEADHWLDNCRSTLPEAGSYIIKMKFPLNNHPNNDNANEKPFSRKVTEHLMISLNQLANHTDLEKSLNLNANFCFGLEEMKPPDHITNFDFSMTWGNLFPVDIEIPTKVSIRNDSIPTISKIAQNLKPNKEASPITFVGKILSLDGSLDENGQMEGDFAISLLVDEEPMKARGFLKSEYYRQACDAHKENKYVKIAAILQEKPRNNRLIEISHFEVLEK